MPVVKRARQTPYPNQCVLIGCLVFLKWACNAYRLCVGEPLRIAKTKMRMIDHNEVATSNVFCKEAITVGIDIVCSVRSRQNDAEQVDGE